MAETFMNVSKNKNDFAEKSVKPIGKKLIWFQVIHRNVVKDIKNGGQWWPRRQGEEKYEEYEVEFVQPFGLICAKRNDGGTNIDAIAHGGISNRVWDVIMQNYLRKTGQEEQSKRTMGKGLSSTRMVYWYLEGIT